MVKVGDRIRLSSMKGPDREGVVTAVTGSLVRVRWPSEEETTVVPAPGTLVVLAAGEAAPPRSRGRPETAGAKKTASTSGTPKKNGASKTKGAVRPTR